MKYHRTYKYHKIHDITKICGSFRYFTKTENINDNTVKVFMYTCRIYIQYDDYS